jgi:hypothetical protein
VTFVASRAVAAALSTGAIPKDRESRHLVRSNEAPPFSWQNLF